MIALYSASSTQKNIAEFANYLASANQKINDEVFRATDNYLCSCSFDAIRFNGCAWEIYRKPGYERRASSLLQRPGQGDTENGGSAQRRADKK
jgi:hypothetical protein